MRRRAGREGGDALRLPRVLLREAARHRWASGAAGFALRRRHFERLVRRLAASPEPERRALAALLAAAVAARDGTTAAALASTAARIPDLRAEKAISRRYRFLWLCNPKAASRSIIAGLRAADPALELVRHRSVGEIVAARPEVAQYTSFAFLRHPAERALSFWSDKHRLALTRREARRRFIHPWHGLRPGMGFDELCRWLETPCGADAFADRHWLSQHLQVRGAGGRLPDVLGRVERLDADWRALCGRLAMPYRPLPRLNAAPGDTGAAGLLDRPARARLARRYAADFRLGGYAPGEGAAAGGPEEGKEP